MKFLNQMHKKALALALLLGGAGVLQAQEAAGEMVAIEADFIFELRILAILMIVIIGLLSWITLVVTIKDPAKISWQALMDNFTGRDAEDPMMDHEYDGIRELDNPVPAWLAAIFYGSIGFGVVYLFIFHVVGWAPLSGEEYASEVAMAEVMYKDVELPDDALVFLDDPMSLANGQETFKSFCATCHGDLGQGGAGPNMTDDYWLHGNTIPDLYKTITNGVPEKGMISWKSQLTSKQRLEVASYIQTLHGTNPPGAKAPQGKMMSKDGTVTGEEAPAEEANPDEVNSEETPPADDPGADTPAVDNEE